MSLNQPHNEFLELCAVSNSGQLSGEEQNKLQEHLAVCESCRETLKQYETVVNLVIPALVANEADVDVGAGPDWSEHQQRQAEQAFFKRLERTARDEPRNSASTNEVSITPHRLPPFFSESAWRHVWMLYAAGILLFATISFYTYRVGTQLGFETHKVSYEQPPPFNQQSLEAQLSDAGRERQLAREQVEQREKTIAALRQQMAQQVADINSLEAAKDRLESDLRAGDISRRDLIQQRAELAQRLDAAMSSSQALSTLSPSSQPKMLRAASS